jgi:hypothetical protein
MDHRRPRHDRELAMAHDRRRHARAHGALLTQNRATLRLRILEPADATLTVEDTARLLQAHDEPTPGLRRIVIRTTTPATTSARFVIVAEPGSAPPSRAPLAIRALDAW